MLKLLAADVADLEVISAAAQDALVRAGDIVYDQRARRFSAQLSRFRWEKANAHGPYERVRAALAFEGVLGVKTLNFRREPADAVADILALRFEADEEPPGGTVRIVLAGGGEIALDVEALDAALIDLGPVWPTQRRPDHDRAERQKT